jgi:hypothetical protein
MYSWNLITVGAVQWTKTVKISLSWGHCNAPVSLQLATFKFAQLFHPLKLSSTIGNYVSNSSTCFLCPLPSPHPFSLLHCSSLHWMLVWVCVSCGGVILISATLLAKAFICISENLWTLRNNWAQLSWNTDAGKYHRPNGDLCNCKLPLEPWQVKEL